jgi:DNA modification methylase
MRKSIFELYHGDCKEVLSKVDHTYDFTLIDPPFNIGQSYNQFVDRNPKFTEWLNTRLLSIYNKMHGIMVFYGPDELVDIYLKFAQDYKLERVDWCVWQYNFGQDCRSKFVNTKSHVLIYKTPGFDHQWFPDLIGVQSARAKMGDKRSSGKLKVPGQVWGTEQDGKHWGRVTGNAKERWNKEHGAPFPHPNQLPLKLVQRLILSYTKPEDLVLDPFLGTGTTGLVCKHEKRDFVGIDVSDQSLISAGLRIKKGFYRYYDNTEAACTVKSGKT